MGEDLQVKIEQQAIAVIDELRTAKTPRMSVEALAKEVFPNAPNARMIIQRMRKPQANGKTRAVSLGEFVDMCRAVGKPPLEVLAVVLNRIEETKTL